MKRVKFYVKAAVMLLSGAVVLPLMAETSAPSDTVSANPSISHFKAVEIGESSEQVYTRVKNIGSADLDIYSLDLFGAHADQFGIEEDNCTGEVLSSGAECNVGIKFSPTQQGTKQALLQVSSSSEDTPTLQAFLTNYEDLGSKAARRLPPVLYSLDVPERMVSGQTYILKWSLLGYHENYASSLVMFDCTGVNSDCGGSYSDSTRFFSSSDVSGSTVPVEAVVSDWNYDGLYAKEFKYEVPFTPSFDVETNIVLRLYRRNINDAEAGLGGLSLLIPGNLAENYYDKEGRRLQKTIGPSF